MTNSKSKRGGQKPQRTAQKSTPQLPADAFSDEETNTTLPSAAEVETESGVAPSDFQEDVNDEFDDGVESIFGESDLFDTGNAASLSSLGIASPDGGDVNSTNLFRTGVPRNLQAPPPREGYAQKFIRYLNKGEKDVSNIMKSQQWGWVPRKIDDASISLPTKKIGSSSIIMINGLVLCEMPLERRDAIKMARRAHTNRQSAAVESEFKGTGRDGGVPVTYDENVQTKKGKRQPRVAGNHN